MEKEAGERFARGRVPGRSVPTETLCCAAPLATGGRAGDRPGTCALHVDYLVTIVLWGVVVVLTLVVGVVCVLAVPSQPVWEVVRYCARREVAVR